MRGRKSTAWSDDKHWILGLIGLTMSKTYTQNCTAPVHLWIGTIVTALITSSLRCQRTHNALRHWILYNQWPVHMMTACSASWRQLLRVNDIMLRFVARKVKFFRLISLISHKCKCRSSNELLLHTAEAKSFTSVHYENVSFQSVFCSWQCFYMGQTSPQECPFLWEDLDPHLIHGSLGPLKLQSQTASRSVQPFLQGSRTWPTDQSTTLLMYSNRLLWLDAIPPNNNNNTPGNNNNKN